MNTQSFVGYFFVSGICLLLNNAILIIADKAGSPLLISVFLSYCIVVSVGYLLHSLISFRQPFGLAAFGRYAFAMAANVPLMFGIIWFWRNVLGLPMTFAAPIATGCMFFLNFILCRWAVSSKSNRAGMPKFPPLQFDRDSLLADDAPCIVASK